MGLEAVKEEILNSAKAQAASIVAESRREAAKIIKDAEKRIAEMSQKSEAEAKKAIENMKKQEIASAEMENKKTLLESKKQVIESVFAEARKRLEGIDDKKREQFIKKLVERAKNDIEIGYVYCGKRDAKYLKGFNAEPADMIGGFIAENKDKTIRVDYSFEAMLQGIKESDMQNINKILFG